MSGSCILPFFIWTRADNSLGGFPDGTVSAQISPNKRQQTDGQREGNNHPTGSLTVTSYLRPRGHAGPRGDNGLSHG